MEYKCIIAKTNGKLNRVLEDYGFSYKTLKNALKCKDVKVNGKRISSKKIEINKGDKIEIYYHLTKDIKKHYSIIYIDNNVLVLDKMQGITSENLYNEILLDYPTALFIHRLDRNTSGVMIFALNPDAEKELLKGFKQRTFRKLYFAEVIGKMPQKQAVLVAYLVKDSLKSEVFIFDKKVKESVEIKTGYKVIKEKEKTTELEVELFTGKTHQIRAHLAHIGHPIVGDGKYGDNKLNKELKISKQRLVSYKLTLAFEAQSSLKYLDKKEFTSRLIGE